MLASAMAALPPDQADELLSGLHALVELAVPDNQPPVPPG